MEEVAERHGEQEEKECHAVDERHAVTVFVNKGHVRFRRREETGAEIKAAAITQGVQIQPDFVLFEVKGHGSLKQIADHERVKLHEHEHFRAVAPDDNSGETS
jgi:hypothetical protein